MIISIAGMPGTGKTSAGKLLSEALGNWPIYSVGSLRGKMAEDRGITIDQLNALGENESFTDKEVDDYQTKLGKEQDNFIIEGRLAWYFIPHSFKVLLTCDSHTAAERVFSSRKNPNEQRNDEIVYKSVEEAEQTIKERIESDARRYKKYYGVDYTDRNNYDLVIDTTNLPGPEATAKMIMEQVRSS
jgi:predicted cytidylate kinase